MKPAKGTRKRSRSRNRSRSRQSNSRNWELELAGNLQPAWPCQFMAPNSLLARNLAKAIKCCCHFAFFRLSTRCTFPAPPALPPPPLKLNWAEISICCCCSCHSAAEMFAVHVQDLWHNLTDLRHLRDGIRQEPHGAYTISAFILLV